MLRNGMIRITCNTVTPVKQLTHQVRHVASTKLPLTEAQARRYPQVEQEVSEDGFRMIQLQQSPRAIFGFRRPEKRRRISRVAPKREMTMPDDIDWPSVWSTARTFVPSAVPLPIRQSFEMRDAPRGKYNNTELLKIANFLHLTPDAVKRHCQAIKKFCSHWPDNLDTDQQVRDHFPITFITRDYVHASSSIRDARARKVLLKININDLKLEERDRIKFIELARHRYNPENEMLTITVEACPFRIQNQDYADYLLSAIYFESQDHQDWENDRFDAEAIHRIDLDEYRKSVEKKLGLSNQ